MELSEGRTVLARNHRNSGVLVHEAGEEGGFLQVYVSPTRSMDANTDEFCIVGDDNNPSFCATIGKASHQLWGEYPGLRTTQLVFRNVYVHPYEQVWISCSQPSAFLAYGTASKRPAWA